MPATLPVASDRVAPAQRCHKYEGAVYLAHLTKRRNSVHRLLRPDWDNGHRPHALPCWGQARILAWLAMILGHENIFRALRDQ
jgi:hypothetical protein